MSDSDNVKPGGLTETVLTEKVVFPLFLDILDIFLNLFSLFWTFSPFCSCFNFQGVEVSIVPFSTMRHGFLTRGNMEDPEVAAEVLFSSIFVFK